MHQHTIYLRSHRKKWALSQQQVADLIGLQARSVISSYELGGRAPNLRCALALQFVFGVSITALYPTLFEAVQDEVMRRAAALETQQRGRDDLIAQRHQELLTDMLGRVNLMSL